MNQTRVFLLLAWLMVATLLWMEWSKEQDAARAPAPVAQDTTTTAPIPMIQTSSRTTPTAATTHPVRIRPTAVQAEGVEP